MKKIKIWIKLNVKIDNNASKQDVEQAILDELEGIVEDGTVDFDYTEEEEDYDDE
jgi:hypothetical protein